MKKQKTKNHTRFTLNLKKNLALYNTKGMHAQQCSMLQGTPAPTHRGDCDCGLASEESEANLGLRAKQE